MIKVGDMVKTTEAYTKVIYEPLYHENVLEGEVVSINNDNIATVVIIETSCNFNARFNHLMNNWIPGTTHDISVSWLETLTQE